MSGGTSRRGGRRRTRRRCAAGSAALAALFLFPAEPSAHEIPTDVIVRAFISPERSSLNLVVRVPLTSMRDVNFPVRGPGYVDLRGTRPLLADLATLWIAGYVRLFEGANQLPAPVVTAVRISLPSDPSFADLGSAVAHIRGAPLSDDTDLVLEQAMLDVLLSSPIESQDARFSIDPEWAHLGIRTTTLLRFVTAAGTERIYQYEGNPGLVRLDPRWHQAFLRFVSLGFDHILDGIDHLLFLLCLILPVRRFWALVPIVTAFTVAHSITLIGSAFGLAPNVLWFPPLIETLIAASIVYMALENIVGGEMRRRWMWAFGFGLVHGFGFSFALREVLQFAGGHLIWSLLAFNVGVELGQLLVLAVLVPVLAFLFARIVSERMGTVLVAALVAHTSWHWMVDRWGRLTAYDFRRPSLDPAFYASLLRWVLLLAVITGAAWMLAGVYGRLARWQRSGTDGVTAVSERG